MPHIIPNQLGENAAALIRRIWAAENVWALGYLRVANAYIFHRLRGADGQGREVFRQQRRQIPDAAELPGAPFAVEPVDHLSADIGVPVEHDPFFPAGVGVLPCTGV